MQALWQRMHPRTSDWCTHGFIRGIMRSITSITNTAKTGDGDQHQFGGLNVTRPPLAASCSPRGALRSRSCSWPKKASLFPAVPIAHRIDERMHRSSHRNSVWLLSRASTQPPENRTSNNAATRYLRPSPGCADQSADAPQLQAEPSFNAGATSVLVACIAAEC